LAAERPLVCVFDHVHWSEETFLDLVEHVADLSRDAPILLLCMARPDLLDRRTGWGGGKVNATTVLLGPLAPEETERLVGSLATLDDALRARISQAAEGNPLFVEEMVALVRESGDGEVTVPPTIQALLAARLDQLEAHEREVLQCGSVEGRVFHRGAVQALAPEEPIKDSPSRVDAAKQAFADLGVEIKDLYWTLAAHDLVGVIEAPDDEAMTAAMLRLSSVGNVRTTTMRAFSRGEFEGVAGQAG
jgi:uncharacterized protein with GYD domain